MKTCCEFNYPNDPLGCRQGRACPDSVLMREQPESSPIPSAQEAMSAAEKWVWTALAFIVACICGSLLVQVWPLLAMAIF